MENEAVQTAPEVKKKKWFKKRDADAASMSAIISFCGSTFFSRGIGELLASYFTLFLTDFMLIPTAQITVLMLVTRILDAFTDPIAGSIVDITHTRWGNARPYVLWSSFPLAIFTVLIFMVPNLSMMGRLVYVYVTYIGYGLAQTMFSVPLATLGQKITAHPEERKNIYTISGFMGTFGTAIPGSVPIILQFIKTHFDETKVHSAQETAYFVIALVIGVGTLVFGITSFFAMKEKVQPLSSAKTEKVKLTKNLGAIFKNRRFHFARWGTARRSIFTKKR